MSIINQPVFYLPFINALNNNAEAAAARQTDRTLYSHCVMTSFERQFFVDSSTYAASTRRYEWDWTWTHKCWVPVDSVSTAHACIYVLFTSYFPFTRCFVLQNCGAIVDSERKRERKKCFMSSVTLAKISRCNKSDKFFTDHGRFSKIFSHVLGGQTSNTTCDESSRFMKIVIKNKFSKVCFCSACLPPTTAHSLCKRRDNTSNLS